MQLKSPRSIKKVTTIIEFQPLQSYKKKHTQLHSQKTLFIFVVIDANCKQTAINHLTVSAGSNAFSYFPNNKFSKAKERRWKVGNGRKAESVNPTICHIKARCVVRPIIFQILLGCVVLSKISAETIYQAILIFLLISKMFCWKKQKNECWVCELFYSFENFRKQWR